MSELPSISSTGRSATETTRFNAIKHGVLSRYAVLPWEDPAEYQVLLAALAAEHAPRGPTEEHLVEELAGIMWRKRRLRLAETALHRHALHDTFASYRETASAALVLAGTGRGEERIVDAVTAGPDATAEELADLDADEAMTRRALELLRSNRRKAYEAALAALREDTRDWWQSTLEEDEEEPDDTDHPLTPTAPGLDRFLEEQVMPFFENRRRELARRPLLREQAFGESLDPHKIERLARYETHLDRKLERTLAMLLKLEELRETKSDG